MGTHELLMAFAVGTALLAVWSFVRWPGAAPSTLKAAIAHVVLALVALQVGAALLGVGLEAIPAFAILVVTGVVVPVLTYAFLASIWFLRMFADELRGA